MVAKKVLSGAFLSELEKHQIVPSLLIFGISCLYLQWCHNSFQVGEEGLGSMGMKQYGEILLLSDLELIV